MSKDVLVRLRKIPRNGDEFELKVDNNDYLILSYDVRKLIQKLQRAKKGESVKLINTKIKATKPQYAKIAEYLELVLESWIANG